VLEGKLRIEVVADSERPLGKVVEVQSTARLKHSRCLRENPEQPSLIVAWRAKISGFRPRTVELAQIERRIQENKVSAFTTERTQEVKRIRVTNPPDS
jgi:hypothetical protein